MKNGWSGGQYSLFRAVLGAYLLIHFAMLLPYGVEVFSSSGVLPDASLSPLSRAFPNLLSVWDSPTALHVLLSLGCLASLLLSLGLWDRVAAVALWYLWACLLGRNPLITNPSLPYVGWMLIAHALIPGKPYGSWSARGRVDPRGGWSMPRGVFFCAWIALALGYTYSGWTKLVSPSWLDGSAIARVLENPLSRPGLARDALRNLPPSILCLLTWGALRSELLFTPLALVRPLRPWVWSAMLSMHLGLITLIDFADLSFGMVLAHFFTFDPDWVRPKRAGATERLFYDGTCGLCHRFVRFALSEDRSGSAFRFAPLNGETFRESVPEREREGLPDSLVVQTSSGRLLVRSEAALHVLECMGGAWRILALGVRVVPPPLRDAVYDGVARIRRRVFAAPTAACPLAPRELAARLDH